MINIRLQGKTLVSLAKSAARQQRVLLRCQGQQIEVNESNFVTPGVDFYSQTADVIVQSKYDNNPWIDSNMRGGGPAAGAYAVIQSDDIGDDGKSDGDFNDCTVYFKSV